MPQNFSGLPLIILLVLVVVMFVFSQKQRKKMAHAQEERARKLKEDLYPGAWIMTYGGLWFRFVRRDGDVFVVETPAGEEVYVDVKGINLIGVEPPFAVENDEPISTTITTDDVDDEADEIILGLDTPANTSQIDKDDPSSFDDKNEK